MTENTIAGIVFESGLKVHRTLGPGLLESAYEVCLHFELERSGLLVEEQKPLPIVYEGVQLETGFRIDLMVENKFIIEIKSVASLTDIHMAQILTYLKLSNCKLGMLINFNTHLFRDGVKRVINGRL
ncbi:MAG TPA: GxxExxY protein [Saprospiraceae bacterium]|nr:GxxExxY protein [Saprospiraceae bacterium]HPI09271.1 GxxExxY protein [Saprospiraceae bacterium]